MNYKKERQNDTITDKIKFYKKNKIAYKLI